ncbi:hypothetical protein [Nannocystis punicea]|uniref:Uncharacterized protein n=1 Tax=Nannocystis punicea TaxID=2995304 RepID=A0ABY7HA27_9BACT|nr:hypothetical protein [Nannocystis poenicansa]WAS95945.1 hypothetical protein O0S08_07250 [Nannocystis poenicansa]
MQFEAGDEVVCFPTSTLAIGRVLAAEEAGLFLVQLPCDDPEDEEFFRCELLAEQLYLVRSTRRRFLDDVLASVARRVRPAHVAVALDRYWVEASDRGSDELVAVARGAEQVRREAGAAADALVKEVQARLRACFEDMRESQQITCWEAGVDYWLGDSPRAPHGTILARRALLRDLRPGSVGDDAYELMLAGVRPFRIRCEEALAAVTRAGGASG